MAMPTMSAPHISLEDFQRMLEEHSELSIEVVNHVIGLMNDSLRPQMFFCSDIYYMAQKKSCLSKKIAKWTDFVQIHFIDMPNHHYLISCQVNGHLSIYDSVDNKQHVEYLLPQLQIVYEDVNVDAFQYKVPQTQGNEDLNLCGFFAVANAISLLNGEVPEGRLLDKSSMRGHLYKCISDKKLCLFPQCTDVFENTRHGHGSLKDGERISSPSRQQLDFISNTKLGSTTEDDLYKLVDRTDLDYLMKCCGENWLHLALFVSMPDNCFQNNFQAKLNVFKHFADVNEMIKDKKYPKFDVEVLDLLKKMYLLMKTGINWEALKKTIKSNTTSSMTHEEIQAVSVIVNDFRIFWVLFNLPHLNVKERLSRFHLSGDNLDGIDKALCKLNDDIEKLNNNKEKVALFLGHEDLMNIIKTSGLPLGKRINKFSEIEVNLKLVQEKYGSLGIPEGMENKMLHDSNVDIHVLDIDKEYVLENDHMVGDSLESGLGKGTLGWPIKDKKSGFQYFSTSLHNMFNSDRMKILEENYNGYMDHKTLKHSFGCGWLDQFFISELDCKISSRMFLFEICMAIYKQGCSAQARFDDKGSVEIALLRMKKSDGGKEKKIENCLIKKNMLQQWIALKLRRVLFFNGKILRYCDLRNGMQVLKIGNKTGITKAAVTEKDVHVRCQLIGGKYSIELHFQIAVQWLDDDPFSTEGDSGAPVFLLEESGEILAIGMVSASQKPKRRSIITPVGAILNACGMSLAPFKIILKEKS